MRTSAILLLLFGLLTAAPASAAISAGVQVAQPAGFGGYLSFWPSDLVSLDAMVTHRVMNLGLTGHIPLSDAEALPAHRLLVAASVGRVHNAFDEYVVGTDLGAAIGYGYQAGWDLRMLAGVGGYNGVGWAWAPTFTAMIGRIF